MFYVDLGYLRFLVDFLVLLIYFDGYTVIAAELYCLVSIDNFSEI